MTTKIKKLSKPQLLGLFVLVSATIYVLNHKNASSAPAYNSIDGRIFGTLYNITYQHNEDLKPDIEQELKQFDASLSPFNATSVITKINNNENVKADAFFRKVFHRSMEVSEETDGAFDITVAPLVNAWNFGFKKGSWPTETMIDSLLQITGYRRITMQADSVIKQDPRIMITCSAIAKGYACDVIGQLLDRKGIKNYMIDIGGEIVVKGKNSKEELWHIGINKPVTDSLAINQEIQTILQLTDISVATSGNYRNYYYKDGKKYVHTIDPHTGYPVEHNLLSATVIAHDCMTADALATAFMVMGLDKAKAFADTHPGIAAYFIYGDDDKVFNYWCTKNMEKYLSKE
ncbi:FAD:protein FMN transferase [termite gut metagenome]|uniref:FAD:protein FMN transferase n=1 Tax=termite gut metagenome TaxID=433724 RepID=A0A5J4SKF7_9ZZZZ